MLYMIIENFRDGDAEPIYRRFREQGRLAPDGLEYLASWVDQDLQRCFQVMRTERRELIDQWIANWSDLVEFEVCPVITSAEASERVAEKNKLKLEL